MDDAQEGRRLAGHVSSGQAHAGPGLTGQVVSGQVVSGQGVVAQPSIGPASLEPPISSREIEDVETLRVVAEPLRIAILRVLMNGAEFHPPVMSAKEMAAALNEPQTKLYRHLKQLEDAGLIHVAETRLVSGIVEQRYRTAQLSIGMSPELIRDPRTRDETMEVAVAAFNDFRDELLANVHAGRTRMDAQHGVGTILQLNVARIPAERAAELYERMSDLMRDFNASGASDGIPVHMLVAWYSTDESPSGRE